MSINARFLSDTQTYFHLIISDEVDFSNFVLSTPENKEDGFIIRLIEGKYCKTVDQLFEQFSKKLDFPDYFGYNWAAFDECINDLDWLLAQRYMIFISNINEVLPSDSNNFEVFITTLNRSIQEWIQGRNYDDFPTPPTPFHVVFHCLESQEDVVKVRLRAIGIDSLDTIIL